MSRFAGNRYRHVEQIDRLFHLKTELQPKDCGGGSEYGWLLANPE